MNRQQHPETGLNKVRDAFCHAYTFSIFCVLAVFALPAKAQCVNSDMPSCSVYTSCFSKLCSCKNSPFEYFESYGKKYCEVFLDNSKLSDKGRLWRDSTLRCLQEEIVRALPPVSSLGSCDCKQMQVKAFDTHVACYTQASASICDLPLSDWIQISSSSDAVRHLADQKGRKQIFEVASACISKLSGDAKKEVDKIIEKLR